MESIVALEKSDVSIVAHVTLDELRRLLWPYYEHDRQRCVAPGPVLPYIA